MKWRSQMYYEFSNVEFKDFLIRNKYATYQQLLETSISPGYNNRYRDFSDEQRQEHHDKYYHSLRYFKIDINKINYSNVDAIKFNKDISKIKIKESICFDKRNTLSFIIAVDYEISITYAIRIYIPEISKQLTLNGIPVKYIYFKDQYVHYVPCKLLRFSFDLSSYCKSITYVLKSYKRKRLLFKFLPFEILRHILYLTSLC